MRYRTLLIVLVLNNDTYQISQSPFDLKNENQTVLNKLMPLIYGELRRMAKRYISGQPAKHIFQTTNLIHETCAKLTGQYKKQWKNR